MLMNKNDLLGMFPVGDPCPIVSWDGKLRRLHDPISAGMSAVTSGIGAVGSIVGGITGSSAASKAAKQQAAAGNAAAGATDKATGQAIDAGYAGMAGANSAIDTGVSKANEAIDTTRDQQGKLYGDMTAGLQPYQSAGAYGINKLQSTAGTFGFNPSDLQNDPGYQFQLQQGLKSLNNTMAGRMLSGGNLKATENYAQGLAGTSYQSAYNRALSTYGANQQGYLSLANLGQNANSQAIQAGGIYGGQLTSLANLSANTNMQGAGLKSNVSMQGNEYIGDTGLRGTEAAGNFRTGAANASAAGTVGAASAWNGALSGVGNAATNYGVMRSLNSMQGSTPPGFMPYASAAPYMPSYSGGGYIPGSTLQTPGPGLSTILNAPPSAPPQ